MSVTPATQAATPAAAPVRASVADSIRVVGGVLAPVVAQGPIRRRPWMVRLAARLDVDRRGGEVLRRLRARYGTAPVLLRLPMRRFAIVLDPADVARMLDDSPVPFSPATAEKTAALRHFQPHGVLISTGTDRDRRRAFNEAALQTDHPLHGDSTAITAAVGAETGALLAGATRTGRLAWPEFDAAHQRQIRRIVLGPAARDDTEMTRMLNRLRDDANWVYAHPRRDALRRRFSQRLAGYVAAPEPGSLAALVASLPAAPGTDKVGQIPHWMFAFDALGIVTFRALALLAADPGAAARAREEVAGGNPALPYLRACVEESLRLWPTTLVILRQAGGTSYVIVSSFFHRDATRLPYADRFVPDIWLDGRGPAEPGLVPFSAGPARCPGRELVLLVGSHMLATLLAGAAWQLSGPALDPAALPRTLDHTGLRFRPLSTVDAQGWFDEGHPG